MEDTSYKWKGWWWYEQIKDELMNPIQVDGWLTWSWKYGTQSCKMKYNIKVRNIFQKVWPTLLNKNEQTNPKY